MITSIIMSVIDIETSAHGYLLPTSDCAGLEPDAAAKALSAAAGSVRAALAGQALPTRAVFSGPPAAWPQRRAAE
jgi:hypothetical protein